jgi:hypothetical protein
VISDKVSGVRLKSEVHCTKQERGSRRNQRKTEETKKTKEKKKKKARTRIDINESNKLVFVSGDEDAFRRVKGDGIDLRLGRAVFGVNGKRERSHGRQISV